MDEDTDTEEVEFPEYNQMVHNIIKYIEDTPDGAYKVLERLNITSEEAIEYLLKEMSKGHDVSL